MNVESPASGIFSGLVICLELGTIPPKKKKELNALIVSHGGAAEFVIHSKTTHVVTSPALLESFKIKNARKYGCLVVTEDFITACVHHNKKVDIWPYLFIDSEPASKKYGKSSFSFVGKPLLKCYQNVVALKTVVDENSAIHAMMEACRNIAGLCVGLGTPLPKNQISVKEMSSRLHVHLKTKSSMPQIQQQQDSPRSSLFQIRYLFSPRSISSFSTSSPSLSSLDRSIVERKPPKIQTATLPGPANLLKPEVLQTNTTAVSNGHDFLKMNEKKKEEAERKKQRDEERQKALEQSKAIYLERQEQKKKQDEERLKQREANRLEAEQRRQRETEERFRREKQLREAREQKISQERKKREQLLIKLKEKPLVDLSEYFVTLDEEERKKKEEEEWRQFQEELEASRKRADEQQKKQEEMEEKKRRDAEMKREQREQEEERLGQEKMALKAQKKREYEQWLAIETRRKREEEEERKRKSVLAFQEREMKRQSKKVLGITTPPKTVEDDQSKIFVGAIAFEDIEQANLGERQTRILKDERMNALLRLFERFGTIKKKKVQLEKKLCFVTFTEGGMAKEAVEKMKEFGKRKEVVEQLKEELRKSKKHILIAPLPSFYVRIVKKNPQSALMTKEEDKNESNVKSENPMQVEKPKTKTKNK